MQDPIYSRINIPRPTLTAASGFVLLAALGLWVSELALSFLPLGAQAIAATECALYYLPFIALPVALYMRRRRGLAGAMRLNPLPASGALTAVLLALVTVFCCSALATLWGWALDALGLRAIGGAPTPANRAELMLSIVTMAAVPAVCEELLFRGFVLSAWESRGTVYAICVSAALFSLMHGNLYGLPVYMLVGVVSGFACHAFDSLYVGIVYHTVYNAACLVLSFLVSGQGDAAPEMSASLVFSVALDAVMSLSVIAMLLSVAVLRAHRGERPLIPRVRRPLSRRERLTLWAALLVMLATLVIVAAIALKAVSTAGGDA